MSFFRIENVTSMIYNNNFCLSTRNIEFDSEFCDFKAKSVLKVEVIVTNIIEIVPTL